MFIPQTEDSVDNAGFIVTNKQGEIYCLVGAFLATRYQNELKIFPSKKAAYQHLLDHNVLNECKPSELGVSFVKLKLGEDVHSLTANFQDHASVIKGVRPAGPLKINWRRPSFETVLSTVADEWEANQTPGFLPAFKNVL